MEEQLYAMADLARAISNSPDYTLDKVLSNTEGTQAWALFRLGKNLGFDTSLPMAKDSDTGQKMGNFYVFFASEDTGSYTAQWVARHAELKFFSREMDAAAWALETAGKWAHAA